MKNFTGMDVVWHKKLGLCEGRNGEPMSLNFGLQIIHNGSRNFPRPHPINEPVLSYAPGTQERQALQSTYQQLLNQDPIDVPMYIGDQRISTNDKRPMTPPHDHGRVFGAFQLRYESTRESGD